MATAQNSLTSLMVRVRACTVCKDSLPNLPRPIVQASTTARIVIIGQAPGRRVQESGIPWDDPSGENLRAWLDVSRDDFYDVSKVALIPMGFCYPGSTANGDKPPRPECAPLWHDDIMQYLPEDRLMIIIGQYAQARYLDDRQPTLTATVAQWNTYLPHRVVLPHPSPRNRHWLTKNPWFESETVPAVQARVRSAIHS